jgi:hypothetical protein
MLAASAGEETAAAGGIKTGEEVLLLPDGPGKGVQATPHVAYGKNGYLAAWREGWAGKGGGARVYAARLDADGKVLDAKGIVLAPNKDQDAPQERPRIAFAKDTYLVVWQDFRNGKDYDVLGARVSLEGKVLDAEPIKLAVGPGNQALPDVASDGTGFLIVWQGVPEKADSFQGYAATVSLDGKAGAAIATGVSPQAKVAWDGKSYLAVKGGRGALTATMLGADGKPAGKGFDVLGGTKAATFSLSAAPGKGWLAMSHRSPPDPWGWGGPGGMRCAFVSSDGKVENGGKESYPSSKLSNWVDFGSAKKEGATWPWGESASAWDGQHFVAVWQRHHLTGEKKCDYINCDIVATRVNGCSPVDQEPIPVAAGPTEEKWPALASDGAGKLLCVYTKGADGKSQVAARTISTK